ncbi:hypothetical protein [Synechococcus sp. PCC 7336]|uniref:hypothetical protein n=1 Tax=Synechococcus sp. PCC 7336 TaxID=195250 RepID=UPI00138AD573|nr:hypothetical protein [Synechococcus sp. PCC 7336]
MSLENNVRIKISDLNLEWLDKYPVWTWYEGSPFEAEDEIYPVELSKQDIHKIDVLFIKSVFVTPRGFKFNGSITLHVESEEVYSVEIFFKGVCFGFNTYWPSLALTEIDRFKSTFGDALLPILPLEYKTCIEVFPGEILSEKFFVNWNL